MTLPLFEDYLQLEHLRLGDAARFHVPDNVGSVLKLRVWKQKQGLGAKRVSSALLLSVRGHKLHSIAAGCGRAGWTGGGAVQWCDA